MLVVGFLLTIQRAHDMNTTGWLALLCLVPLVNLLFWFVPGTRGENDYGKQPPPNTVGVIVLACILPFSSSAASWPRSRFRLIRTTRSAHKSPKA